MVAEDRPMCVQPNQVVRTAWVDIDLCRLNFRLPMSPEAVEKKYRRLLNLGECAPWPPIVGHWEDGRFVVCDGRRDYVAALMIGRDKLFVCWLEAAPEAMPDLRRSTRTSPNSMTRKFDHAVGRRRSTSAAMAAVILKEAVACIATRAEHPRRKPGGIFMAFL